MYAYMNRQGDILSIKYFEIFSVYYFLFYSVIKTV